MSNLSFTDLIAVVGLTLQVALTFPGIVAAQQINITNAGVTYTFTSSQPSLSLTSVTSVCTTGVWITYTGQDYSFTGSGSQQMFPKVGSMCASPINPIVGSARLVGLPSDYTANSVTLFSDTYMRGEDSVVYDCSVSSISIYVNSIIIIGISDVYVGLYQYTDYDGNFVCLTSANFSCVNNVCWTMLLYPGGFPWDITDAESADIGCHASNGTFC